MKGHFPTGRNAPITLPPRDMITPDTPLRLEVAAALAFPDGSMSPAALRRLVVKEQLTAELILGKYYTTLADIERMREKCRVPAKAHELEINDRGMYIVRDTGNVNRGTGCYVRDGKKAEAAAQAKLAEYILSKRDPAKAIDKDNPNAAKIADVMALEMRYFSNSKMLDSRKREFISSCERIGRWFGKHAVGDLNGDLQECYARERRRYVMKIVNGERTAVVTDQLAPIAGYRDLKILAAAVNRYFQKKVGGVQIKFKPTLPDGPTSRVRWLSRDEAARMLWAAWRNRHMDKGCLTSRHIARFILVGLYTGSRKGDICGAAVIPTIGRGYVDLDCGIFKRKPDNKEATSKRQPTIPLPPRLLAHMRRWHRLGISQRSVVEYNGKPVVDIKVGFDSVVTAAGLATDDRDMKVMPHSLRHTAITWLLRDGVDIELVSQYVGVSVEVIRKTYRHEMPGQHDPVLKATQTFGRTSIRRVSATVSATRKVK